ncbi:MAG: response regulator transcription factor [Paracoccaceae bacterium]
MRILLADRYVLVRDAMAFYLAGARLPAVTQCGSLMEVLALLAAEKFDLALLDASVAGIDDLPAVLEVAPQLKVGLITGPIGRDQVEAVLRGGAIGVISKAMSGPAFIDAVRDLLDGKQVVPAANPARLAGQNDTPYALTRRELDVLRGLFAGKSNKEIGRDLELQEVTVKLHVKTLSRKLGAKNRTHATMIARNEGLV